MTTTTITVGSKSSTVEIRDAIKNLQADTSGAVEQIEIDELAQLLRDRGTAAAREALSECGIHELIGVAGDP